MVALVGAIIAPAMVVSVATRVQSQKAEQALELAQSEIDNIRVLIERGEIADEAELDALAPSTTTVTESTVANALGPDSLASTPTVYTEAVSVDIDGDGTDDYAVQRYRTVGKVVNGRPVAFAIGVRVYDHNAVANASANLPSTPASLTMVSGEGERAEKPLATLYTTIASSEESQSFCNYIDFIESGASTPLGCN
jgi:type II secretory pathway pseudopilin PulG